MIDFDCLVLLNQINDKLKGTGESYALLGNSHNLQLFRSTRADTFEVCHCTAKSMKPVLESIITYHTNKED